ncbi:hypothetical protein JHK87_005540 [Glycine soja]|nr:hypothetical protein JHK87_005540 [Glycine soja]
MGTFWYLTSTSILEIGNSTNKEMTIRSDLIRTQPNNDLVLHRSCSVLHRASLEFSHLERSEYRSFFIMGVLGTMVRHLDTIIGFPIWGYLKLMFCIWLVMPMFNGAAYIYENYVRQYIKNIGRSSNYSEEYKKVLHMMTFDARKAVERYIGRYGPDAFERVVRAAEKESKKS